MTVERASELVQSLTGEAQLDLFVHFVDYFRMETEQQQTQFARLCGFAVASSVYAS